MSLNYSQGIITNGLIFYYDMSNSKKSWKGRPLTNQFAIPSPAGDGSVSFQVQGSGTFYRQYSGTYGGYDIQPTDIVYKFSPVGSGGCWYHGNDVTINSGQTATWSFDYYVDPSITGYVNTNYLANFEGVVGGSITDPTPSVVGVWKSLTVTATAGSTGTCRMLLYPGACGGYLATGGFVLFKNPQVEFDAPGSNPSPFTPGTRSTANALVDLTNSSVATAGSLVYNSDGTFNLSSSNPSYVQVPLSTAFNKLAGSINVWIYPTSYNGGNGIFVNRTDATANAVDWLWIGPYSGSFYFRLGDGSTCCNNDNSFPNYYSLVPLNTWTNLCCTWKSGGTSVVYINGKSYQSRTISAIPSTSPDTNGRFGLGHANADSYFNGKMPVAQIYNRQLTDDEVLQNFNALRGRYGI